MNSDKLLDSLIEENRTEIENRRLELTADVERLLKKPFQERAVRASRAADEIEDFYLNDVAAKFGKISRTKYAQDPGVDDAMTTIRKYANNVPTLREAVKKYNSLSWRDVAGADGRLDPIKVDSWGNRFNGWFNLADGALAAMRRELNRIESGIEQAEARKKSNRELSGETEPAAPVRYVKQKKHSSTRPPIDDDFSDI